MLQNELFFLFIIFFCGNLKHTKKIKKELNTRKHCVVVEIIDGQGEFLVCC